MNKERVRAIADRIEKEPEHFDMSGWIHLKGGGGCSKEQLAALMAPEPECGTKFCVAGWAVYMFGNQRQKERAAFGQDYDAVAAELLNCDSSIFFVEVSREDIVHMLREMADE